MNTHYREGLPAVPRRMQHLPIQRGYPVPWFVARIDDRYDFRVIDSHKWKPAIQYGLCWLCGQRMGGYKAFVLGPMCAINRTIGEPPSHRDCAEFATQGCPFLNQTEKRRNVVNLPDVGSFSEYGIDRQPGVALLWVTKSYSYWRAPDETLLFTVGDPVSTHWYKEGRDATRAEVLESIVSGYPTLLAMAEQEGPKAIKELEAARDRVMMLLPAEEPS